MAYIQFKLDAEINKTLIVQKTIQVISTSTSEYKLGAKSLLVFVNNPVNLNATTRGSRTTQNWKNKKPPIWYILNTTQTNRR